MSYLLPEHPIERMTASTEPYGDYLTLAGAVRIKCARRSALPRSDRGAHAEAVPNDLAQLLIGLTVLILLAIGFGMSSARLFLWATRGSADGSKR